MRISKFSRMPLVFLGLGVAIIAASCASPKPEPQVVSSADTTAYAVTYPGQLDSLVDRLDNRKTGAELAIASIASYSDELTETDWAVVKELYEESKKAGQSRVYADGMRANSAVETFFSDEHEEITKRVAGAVVAQAKKSEKPCEIEPYGSVSFSLKKSVEKQIEERKQDQNSAHALLEKNANVVGKKNLTTLEKHIDVISDISYIVYIEIPQILGKIEEMTQEKRDVRKKLEKDLQSDRDRLKDEGLSKKDKKAIEDGIAATEKSLADLDASVEAAQKRFDLAIEKREVEELRAGFEDAFDSLIDALNKKGGLASEEQVESPPKTGQKNKQGSGTPPPDGF